MVTQPLIVEDLLFNPVVLIDLEECLSEYSEDQKTLMSDFHGYNIWYTFTSEEKGGLFRKLLTKFADRFKDLLTTRVLAVGSVSEDVLNDGVLQIVTDTLEQLIMDLYQETLPLYQEGGAKYVENIEPMTYSQFEENMGISTISQIVDHDFIDSSGIGDAVSHLIIKFTVKLPVLGRTQKIEALIRNLIVACQKYSTEKSVFAFGIKMLTKHLKNQKGKDVFNYCIENMDTFLTREELEVFTSNVDSLSEKERDEFVSLVNKFPILDVDSTSIDGLLSPGSFIFLNRCVKPPVCDAKE